MKNLVFLFLVSLSNISLAQEGLNNFKLAIEKRKEKKYKDAISYCNKAIQADPANDEYYLERSQINIYLNDAEAAFKDINKAIAINPASEKGYIRRGDFYHLIDQYDKSIIDFSNALERAKEDSIKVRCLVSRSSSKLAKMDYDGCRQDCNKALTIDSLSIGALNNLAISMSGLEYGEEVLKVLKKIIEIDPSVDYAYMNMGYKLSVLGRHKESLPYFDKAISMNPHNPYGYSNRGFAKLKNSDIEGAMDDLNKSIKQDPTNSYAFKNRGLVYLAQKKHKKACEDWDEAIRLGYSRNYGKEVEELIKTNCLQ